MFQHALFLSRSLISALIFSMLLPLGHAGEIGNNDIRLTYSDASDADARFPRLAYNSQDNEYFMVWRWFPTPESEGFEIYGQRLNAVTGARIGDPVRLSDMGPDGLGYSASSPAVAYNSQDNEYFVVWSGDDNEDGVVQNELEIYGQRVLADGTEQGGDVRLSTIGPVADTSFSARNPAIAYNAQDNVYLVACDASFMNAGEFEIFTILIDVAGTPIDTLWVSDLGAFADEDYDSRYPAIAYNAINNQYLVVWTSDDNTAPLVDNEFEIYGQLVAYQDPDLVAIGADDFRISDMGSSDGVTSYTAFFPTVAHNSVDNQYLVVWQGDDDTAPSSDDNIEVFGQRLSAEGDPLGENDFLISTVDVVAPIGVKSTKVVYNSSSEEYLVAWAGTSASLGYNEVEIFVQRLSAAGAEIGINDIRVSDLGEEGNRVFEAENPDVVFNPTNDEYFIVWDGDDYPTKGNGQYEIYGQRFQSFAAIPLRPSASVESIQFFPNPFNPADGLGLITFYDLPAFSTVTIFDPHGQKMRTLLADADGVIQWNGQNASGQQMSSGVYYVQAGNKAVKIAIQR